MNEFQTTKQWLATELGSYYSQEEAEYIARILLEEAFGQPYPMLVVSDGKVNQKIDLLKGWLSRLLGHEPLQYVLGHTSFCGMDLYVSSGVLIPRPETEELCYIIRSRGHLFPGATSIDLCTGSGAIALFMAKCGAKVEAIDLSPHALSVAERNFHRYDLEIDLRRADLFDAHFSPKCQQYDLVVSNPPYVLNKERMEMEPHVLETEPEMALFVPDDDPILFYSRIKELYNNSKVLAFEINPLCVGELRELFYDRKVEFIEDFNGKTRYLIVT